MSWGAVAGGAISVGAGLLGGKGKKSSSSQIELPGWLQSALQDVAPEAHSRIMERGVMSPDEQVAGLNPEIMQAIGQMTGYGAEGGTGNAILDMLMQGGSGVDAMGAGQDLITQAASRGPSVDAGADLGRVAEMADNPFMDQMVDAALRDPTRQFTEQQMPAARLAQAMSGNTGSTRGAIGEAVLQRGYEDRAADIGASIRGGAWQDALGLEAGRSARNAGLDQTFTQLLGGFGTNLASTGAQSANVLNLANNIGLGNMELLLGGGNIMRGYEQDIKNAEMRNFDQPVQDMQAYTDILNSLSGSFAGQTTTTQGPGALSGALGGLSTWLGSDMAAGMFDGWGGGGGGEDFYQSSINFLDPNALDLLPTS